MSFLRVEAIARYNMQSRAQVTHWALNKCSLDWFWKIAKLAKGWLEASATNYVALVWRLPYMQTAQLKQDSSVSINLPAINAPSLKPWKVALNINYHGQALCQGLDRHHSSLNCKATLRYSFLKIKRQRGKLPKAKHKVIKSGFKPRVLIPKPTVTYWVQLVFYRSACPLSLQAFWKSLGLMRKNLIPQAALLINYLRFNVTSTMCSSCKIF